MEVTVGGMAQGQNQGAKELLPKERFPLLLIRLVGGGRGEMYTLQANLELQNFNYKIKKLF